MAEKIIDRSNEYIRIEGVTKRFGEFVAVDNVSLNVYKGEIFCLLGGSGCGKTTLLRMLAGFEAPTSGRILIDGQDMADIPPYERPVNMMFQSYAEGCGEACVTEGFDARPDAANRAAPARRTC